MAKASSSLVLKRPAKGGTSVRQRKPAAKPATDPKKES